MRHKTAVVAALSVVGVLVAGATALAANLGILESGPGVGELSAVSDEVPPGGAEVPTQATTPPGDLVAYQVNDVGVVTLAREGDRLSLQSASVGPWSYEVKREGHQVEMVFRQDGRQVNLEAHLEQGLPVVEVWEDHVVAGPSPTGEAAVPTSSAATEAETEEPQDHGTAEYEDDDHDDEDESHEDERREDEVSEGHSESDDDGHTDDD